MMIQLCTAKFLFACPFKLFWKKEQQRCIWSMIGLISCYSEEPLRTTYANNKTKTRFLSFLHTYIEYSPIDSRFSNSSCSRFRPWHHQIQNSSASEDAPSKEEKEKRLRPLLWEESKVARERLYWCDEDVYPASAKGARRIHHQL